MKIKAIHRWCGALLILALFLSGCANARFNMDEASSNVQNPTAEERHVVFLSGFGQQHTINAGKVCGGADKVASLEVDQSITDSVIALLTWGIYTPLSARVYCK